MDAMARDEIDRRVAAEGPHTLSAAEVLVALDASDRGLTSHEARERLARFGPNELPTAEPPGLVRVFLWQFLNPLTYILLVAAAISAVLAAATPLGDRVNMAFAATLITRGRARGVVVANGPGDADRAHREFALRRGLRSAAAARADGALHEEDRGRRPRRRRGARERVFSALVMSTIGFAAYRWMLAEGWPLHQAQNGVLLILVLFENVQAGNSRSETASLFALSPLRNRLLFAGTVAAQLLHIAAMHTPGVRDVLHLEAVSGAQWLASLGLALTLAALSEVHKVSLRRRLRPAAPAAPG